MNETLRIAFESWYNGLYSIPCTPSELLRERDGSTYIHPDTQRLWLAYCAGHAQGLTPPRQPRGAWTPANPPPDCHRYRNIYGDVVEKGLSCLWCDCYLCNDSGSFS